MFPSESSRSDLLKWLSDHGEEPAFVTRARAPQLALDSLHRLCEARRAELLEGPRVHWTMVARLTDKQWSRVIAVAGKSVDLPAFEVLDAVLYTNKPIQPSILDNVRSAWRRFVESAGRFNSKWEAFLRSVDLEPVNRPRRAYNDYYVLEKTCAVGTETALRGFTPLEMIDRTYLEGHFPFLTWPVK